MFPLPKPLASELWFKDGVTTQAMHSCLILAAGDRLTWAFLFLLIAVVSVLFGYLLYDGFRTWNHKRKRRRHRRASHSTEDS